MTNTLKKHFLLLVILLIATCLHLYKLGQIPKILNPDEASIAYNALLLKETGKDEWGKHWPLVLDAFGDQKLIGYPALTVLSFQIFGYSDWAVKIPTVIAGSVLIILIYLLELKLGHSQKRATVSAALIAVIPVFFFYSRVAFEAMVALSYFLGAFLLLLESGKKEEPKTVVVLNIFAGILSLLALLTYNSPAILFPFLLLAVIIDRGVLNFKKWVGIISLLGLIWVSFLLYFLPLTIQKSKITLFGDETTLNEFNTYRSHLSASTRSLVGNKYVFYADKMLIGYAKSWSPAFLMNNVGGHPWHTVPGFGYIYWSVYFFGLIGILTKVFFVLRDLKGEARKKKLSVFKLLGQSRFSQTREISVFLLFIFSLTPVIITVNAPQATRSLLFFFLWTYYAAFGLLVISRVIQIFIEHFLSTKIFWIKTEIGSRVILGILFCIVLFEAGNYLSFYFGTYSTSDKLQSAFQPGFDTFIKQVDDNNQGKPLAIVDERGFNYILLAWYLKLQPNFFFSTVKKQLPDKINFKYGEQVGRYHFIAKPIDRKPSEKTVLEWSYADNKWDVLNY